MPPRAHDGTLLLTETELDIMSILWDIGSGHVADVLAKLPTGRELAYTSVSTIVRILEKKGFVTARKDGRGHVYVPLLSREAYEARSVSHLVSRVFRGEPSRVVAQLLDTRLLTPEDLDALRALVDAERSAAREKKGNTER